MRKKIIVFLIAIVMVVSVLAISGFAESTNYVDSKCGYCKRSGTEIEALITFSKLEKNCNMYAALYNAAGIMRQVKHYNLLRGSSDITISFSESAVSSTDYIKVFFLDKSNLIKPNGKSLYMDFSSATIYGVVIATSRYAGECGTVNADEVELCITDAGNSEYFKEKLWDYDQYDAVLKVADGINVNECFGMECEVSIREISKNCFVITDIDVCSSKPVQLNVDDIDEVTSEEIKYYASETATQTSSYKLDYPQVYLNYVYFSDNLQEFFEDAIYENRDLEITLIENSGDNKYDVVLIKEYSYDRIYEIEQNGNMFTTVRGEDFVADFENEELDISIVNAEGETIGFDKINENDVIAYISDDLYGMNFEKWIEIIVLGESAVTGAVNEVKNDAVYVDGTKYLVVAEGINLGDEGTFYLTRTGKIFDFEKSNLSGENYALVLDGGQSGDAFGESYRVKLLTSDNKIAIYKLRDNLLNTDTQEALIALETETGASIKEDVSDRLITFKLDGNGDIREICFVSVQPIGADSVEYYSDSESLGNVYLEKNTVVFNTDTEAIDTTYAVDCRKLIDGNRYEGYFAENDSEEVEVVIITKGIIDYIIPDEDDETLVDMGYGIVLDGGQRGDDFGEGYSVKLLTENDGIVIYDLHESLLRTDILMEVKCLETEIGDDIRPDIEKRIIKFKVNSRNQIREIEFVPFGAFAPDSVYDAETGTIDFGFQIDPGAVVFNVGIYDIDDTYATTVSALTDGNVYSGVYSAKNDILDCIVITKGIEYEIPEDPDESEEFVDMGYGIVLDGGWSGDDFRESYSVKLLTENDGIVIYELRQRLLNPETHRALQNLETEYGDDIKQDIRYRVVTYKLNGEGEIAELEFVDIKLADTEMSEFYADGEMLGEITLTPDVAVFNIDAHSMDYVYSTDISHFIDGGMYKAWCVKNEQGTADCIIIEEDVLIPSSQNLSIVAETTVISINEGADEALKVRYYTAEEDKLNEIIVSADCDVTEMVCSKYYDISVGDAFVFYDRKDEGIASAFAIVADYEYDRYVLNEKLHSYGYGSGNDFICVDYIDTWASVSAGTKITGISGESYVVKPTSNQYTIEERIIKTQIHIGSWKKGRVGMAEYDGDATLANCVLIRKERNTVKDIISISEKSCIE